jgi:radical SAM-linked protein
MKLRVQFEKRVPLSFSSHRDVVRIVQRGIAAAGIPIAYSTGYHPHMRMSFGPPLKTGWEGFDEYLDVQFTEPVASFTDRCNLFMPGGLKFLSGSEIDPGTPKLANDICAADYRVWVRLDELDGGGDWDDGRLAETSRQAADRLGTGGVEDESTPELISVTARAGDGALTIDYKTSMRAGRVVSPLEVLEAFVSPADYPTPPRVSRQAQYVSRDGEYLSPLSDTVIQGQS